VNVKLFQKKTVKQVLEQTIKISMDPTFGSTIDFSSFQAGGDIDLGINLINNKLDMAINNIIESEAKKIPDSLKQVASTNAKATNGLKFKGDMAINNIIESEAKKIPDSLKQVASTNAKATNGLKFKGDIAIPSIRSSIPNRPRPETGLINGTCLLKKIINSNDVMLDHGQTKKYINECMVETFNESGSGSGSGSGSRYSLTQNTLFDLILLAIAIYFLSSYTVPQF
jgi:hypothetical protein